MKTRLKKYAKKIGYVFGVIVCSVIVGVSLQFAKAWTEPNSATPPPLGNIGAPLTTGGATQTKTGYLNVTGGGAYGTGGIGIGGQSLNSSGPWLYVGNGAGSVYAGQGIAMDNLYVNSLAYAPFIYDTNNTGYYLDPNGSSQLSAVYANGWFRPQGDTGIYFQDHGGGWNMTDNTWIRAYNGKSVWVDGTLNAAAVLNPTYAP